MQYPRGERVWVEAHNAAGRVQYIITSTQARDMYYLYEPGPNGEWKRRGKSPSAGKLEEKYEESKR